jgi:DNA-binding transcriptional LysR family regulator
MAIHKLRALEYLVAVADHGGFNAAARKLGVAAPSVRRLVKALEDELGLRLLDRAQSPLRPTPESIGYVERARLLLAELRNLDAGLKDRTGSPTGTVTLAAQSVVLHVVLGELLPTFHRRYPGIVVDLVDAGTCRDLAQLGTDLLVQFGWPPSQDATLRTLAHTRWLVVATASYWARHGVPAHPARLAEHPCLLFRSPYGEVLRRWSFQRAGERVDVDIDGWLIGDHRSALDCALRAGQLVARINHMTAAPASLDDPLQPVLLDWEGLASPPLTLLIRRSQQRQPRVRAWVDFLAAEAERMNLRLMPAGLPPAPPAQRPEWFRRRVR